MIVPPADLFITCREVQRMLGICRKSAVKFCTANGVRTRRLPGIRVVRYHRHDVERLLNAADVGDAMRSA